MAFPELFAAAGGASADIRADTFGAARAALAHAVFRALTLNPEWRGQLAAITRGLADVLSRRSRGTDRAMSTRATHGGARGRPRWPP